MPPLGYFRFAVNRPMGRPSDRIAAEHEAVSSTSAIAPIPTDRRIGGLRWNDGQDNLRGMLGVQVDRVVGDLRAAVVVQRFSRVWVDVEAGEIAARNVETDAVAPLEYQRGRIHFDGELV